MTKDLAAFENAARLESMEEISSITQPPGINLRYAPSDISEEARSYLDNLDLSENGDFKHIDFPGHDPAISPWKPLFFFQAINRDHIQTDIIRSQMTRMPDRPGLDSLAHNLTQSLKAFWPLRGENRGISGGLQLKYPISAPKFHFDEDTAYRGLLFLKGHPEYGGMRVLENNLNSPWHTQTSSYIIETAVDIESCRMSFVPMHHLSVHQGTNVNPLNPTGHSEPTMQECPQPRLIWMMN